MPILLLLAVGLGVALTAYEFSPHFHTRVDDYARALRSASAAHVAADAHLANASAATAIAVQHAQSSLDTRQATPQALPPLPFMPRPQLPPPPAGIPPTVAEGHDGAAQVAIDAGVDHAANATAANQAAAKSTADAARAAKTDADRREAALSAAKVLEREKKIAQALATLGVGQCGVRSYAGVTPQVRDQLLSRLHTEGMAVTGDNPWDIETNKYGVKLRAAWGPKEQVLRLIVTTGRGAPTDHPILHPQVTCDDIWEKIEPILKGVIGG